MGYRSKVAYTIRFKDRDHRVRFMATAVLGAEIKLYDFGLLNEETILYKYDDIKWYDEYPYVQAHQQLLEDAKAQGCGWEFCRVGEEIGDIEFEGADGIEDEDHTIENPEELEVIQRINVHSYVSPYPVGETLNATGERDGV